MAQHVPTRTLRRDAEINREKILTAAAKLFAERGLAATLNDVAHYAGVGVGTVYRRYPDKAQLLDEIFEERLKRVAQIAEEALGADDPWDGFLTFFEGYLDLQAEDRAFREIVLRSPESMDRLAGFRAELWPVVGRLVERARDCGRVRADYQIQDGPIIAIMLGTVMDLAQDVEPNLWRRYLSIIVQGLMASPDAPHPLPVEPLSLDQVEEALVDWNRR